MNIRFLGTLGISSYLLANSIPVVQDAKEARAENKSVLWAGTKSAVRNNWQQVLMLGLKHPTAAMLGLGVIQMSPLIARTAFNYYRVHSDYLRSISQPFSSRFEHSDQTWRAMQSGMQSITGVRSMLGSEANSMNRRYGRR